MCIFCKKEKSVSSVPTSTIPQSEDGQFPADLIRKLQDQGLTLQTEPPSVDERNVEIIRRSAEHYIEFPDNRK